MKPSIKILTVLLAAGLMIPAFSVAAQAAVVDPDETIALEDNEEITSPLPSRYSSVELGYVTSAKQQRHNDCWAYSATGTLESKLLRSGLTEVDMSVPHMNGWATTRTNGKGWVRSISDLGVNSISAGYLTSWSGGVLVSDLPDWTLTYETHGDEVPTGLTRYGVTGLRYLGGESRDVIKKAIMDNGGVASSYSHAGSLMKDLLTYYMPPDYNGSKTGHAIEVVGWDDDYPKENFVVTPENNGAWLIKNSWGNNNELGGFFWMSYEDKDILTTKYKPSYTVESFEPVTANKKLVQNEIYGATYEFDYLSQQEVTYLNHFEFDEDFDLIDKIIFETTGANAAYTLSFVPDKDGKPSDDQSEWTTLGSGVTDYAGYLCIDIDNFLLPETSGSIAVSLQAAAGKTATIGVGEWLVYTTSDDYLFINESEPGMSYLYENCGFTDLMDWYRVNNDDEIGGTFVIKALTLKPETGDVNLDGEVNVLDATLIQRYLAELDALNDRQLSLADVSGDNNVNIADATLIQMNIAEIEE